MVIFLSNEKGRVQHTRYSIPELVSFMTQDFSIFFKILSVRREFTRFFFFSVARRRFYTVLAGDRVFVPQ